jgi:hypothetical protein
MANGGDNLFSPLLSYVIVLNFYMLVCLYGMLKFVPDVRVAVSIIDNNSIEILEITTRPRVILYIGRYYRYTILVFYNVYNISTGLVVIL